MLKRHYIRPSGFKSDRDWWIVTKFLGVVVISLGSAYVVAMYIL